MESMKGFQYISKAAQIKSFPQLKQLWLDKNKIGQSTDNSFIQKQYEEGLILKFANENTKLQQLYLQLNNINDNDMKILFKNCQKDKKVFHNLLTLHLGDNKIKAEGINVLIEQNTQYPVLQQLYLTKNEINKNGIKYLVSYKNKNTFKNLKNIDLNNNIPIRDEGIQQFFKGCQLGAFPQLQSLDIDILNINLSNNGIEKIIKLHNSSNSLKHLKNMFFFGNSLIIDQKLIFYKLKKRFYLNV